MTCCSDVEDEGECEQVKRRRRAGRQKRTRTEEAPGQVAGGRNTVEVLTSLPCALMTWKIN